MAQILERVSVVPSKIQLGRMLNVIDDECNEGIQDTATGIQKGLAHIAETSSKVPEEMSFIQFLSDKVFSLSSSLLEFKSLVMQSMEHTDNAMTLVHQQREQANARYQESRDDITFSTSQMQELVNTVK